MIKVLITAGVSASGRLLAEGLGIRRMATQGKTLTKPLSILNWGCGAKGYAERYGHRVDKLFSWVNIPARVTIAANKLETFRVLEQHEDIPIPEFTTEASTARSWLKEHPHEPSAGVVARTTLIGHSGEGIHVLNHATEYGPEGGPWIDAPLYVKYKKKKHEYRVHVIGNYTDVQQKRKRQETPNEEVNYQVRNYQNGWVYCREDIPEPKGIRELAQRVVQALELDFGAVDIIWNQAENQMVVLEVNTAPGLEGQTLAFYTEHLGELL